MSPRTFTPRARSAAAALSIAFLAACGESSTEPNRPDPTPVASVQISPDAASLPRGESRQLAAVLRAHDGSQLSGRAVAWSTSDARIATVSAAGLVTTREAGVVTISAASEGRTASARLTVTMPVPPAVASIQLSPDASELQAQRTRQIVAVLRAQDGSELTGRAIIWSSSDPNVAVVGAGGVVTGIQPGAVTIRAESEGKAATARLTVVPRAVVTVRVAPQLVSLEVGAAKYLTVTALDDAGQLVADRPVQFRSDDASIVTVDANGRMVGLRAGVTYVNATVDGKLASARVEVAAPAIPLMAGTWSAVIEDVVGEGMKCTVEGLRFSVTQDGELLGGQVGGLNGGPRVTCEVAGGQPPYTSPFAPTGALTGRVTRDGDAAVVTIQSANGWSFSGTMRDGTFAGLAAYDVQREGGVDSRRGEIYAVRLNQP